MNVAHWHECGKLRGNRDPLVMIMSFINVGFDKQMTTVKNALTMLKRYGECFFKGCVKNNKSVY